MLSKKFSRDRHEGRIVLRNEEASAAYTTEFITTLLNEEGNALGLFDCRSVNLGVKKQTKHFFFFFSSVFSIISSWLFPQHIQQGGAPSPLDRVRAVRFAAKAITWIFNTGMGDFFFLDLFPKSQHFLTRCIVTCLFLSCLVLSCLVCFQRKKLRKGAKREDRGTSCCWIAIVCKLRLWLAWRDEGWSWPRLWICWRKRTWKRGGRSINGGCRWSLCWIYWQNSADVKEECLFFEEKKKKKKKKKKERKGKKRKGKKRKGKKKQNK